jgi:zinc carboxypeptidase
MKKLSALFSLLIFSFIVAAQTVPSPEIFLGYALGSHFTPHFKIVNYFKKVAETAPDMVKLEQYGETNEGRPLLLAYIASPENLKKLESIRINNLRLTGLTKDKMLPDENTPAIVWLSYNVHGNEAASSEAAMKTIYELVNPANTQTKEWLKNVVVIIDPCINPDGRDRYINWYNSVVGKEPNPDPQSREHREPWPGGRTNHYNFDMNRDWAWQTQLETQQRMKKYNEWLPQVHVDYHEQGYNAPYYFAPAAEPYHEVITPWQREFQQYIGKNNAKYFDKNGWLFFTKQEFDLFYPSYGDTYPLYNGAIGMTFEQGGISAGLAVINGAGDTLTLAERALHHYTTGMSTIEVSSQNSAKLVKEFHQYFLNPKIIPGEYKSYLIKNTDNAGTLDALKTLLDRNLIDWGYATAGNFTGLSYQSGKQEMYKAEAGDIVINTSQPKTNLIKVLFERNSKISDSATYDITAWSLPFVYGLNVFGGNVFINSTKENPQTKTSNAQDNGYGYAIKWNGLNSAKFLAGMLKKNVKVRYAVQPFETGGKKFEKGTLLILKTSNQKIENTFSQLINDAAKMYNVDAFPVASGFVDKGFDFGSDKINIIRKSTVALLTGNGVSSQGAGEVWHFFEQQLNYPVTLINADDIGRINWKNIDVLIMPDGYYKFLSDKSASEQLKNWVQQGGKIIALENAVAQLSKSDFGIKQKENADDKKDGDKDKSKKDEYADLHKYESRERDNLMNSTPGSIYRVELDNSHPLAFGYPNYYYTLKQDDNVYEFLKDGGWNVGVIKKDNYVSGFTGSKAKEKLKDGLIFGVQESGRGQIVYLADDVLFRNFWENGKLLFCNAVFIVGE